MKKFTNFVILFIFTPVFILFLTGYTLKFQLLDNEYWKQMLQKEDVYTKLEPTIVGLFREQAVTEGATGA